jgi:hypothetical protein
MAVVSDLANGDGGAPATVSSRNFIVRLILRLFCIHLANFGLAILVHVVGLIEKNNCCS